MQNMKIYKLPSNQLEKFFTPYLLPYFPWDYLITTSAKCYWIEVGNSDTGSDTYIDILNIENEKLKIDHVISNDDYH